MELGRTPRIEGLITELDTLCRAQLDRPDGITTIMSYQFSLPDIYQVQLENRTDTEGLVSDRPDHTTAIFVNRVGEVHDETQCGHQLAFSMLYDHIDNRLGGAQFVSPIDLPQAYFMANNLENIAFNGILKVAAWTYDHRSMSVERPSMEGHYDFGQEELDEGLGELLTPLIYATNNLLAEGAFYERRYKRVVSSAASAWIESNTSTGPQEHSTNIGKSRPRLLAKRHIEGLEYSFEQLEDDSHEVKIIISNYGERYKHYRTFKPTYIAKNGEVMSFDITGSEIKEKEAEDRAMGLFEPTAEKLEFILEPLRAAA